jgi:hypothetical protein
MLAFHRGELGILKLKRAEKGQECIIGPMYVGGPRKSLVRSAPAPVPSRLCLEPICPAARGIVPRSASPFAADAFRRGRMDWSAMSEHGRVEAKRGDLVLAASSFLDILKSYWIAEPEDVHADIACDQ